MIKIIYVTDSKSAPQIKEIQPTLDGYRNVLPEAGFRCSMVLAPTGGDYGECAYSVNDAKLRRFPFNRKIEIIGDLYGPFFLAARDGNWQPCSIREDRIQYWMNLLTKVGN